MTKSVTTTSIVHNIRRMREQRWVRIIPVALIMYTISYVDRTNISLTLDPTISTMMKDLLMDDELKGQAAGIFFIGYLLLQLPGGYLASHWSARKVISIFLVAWGLCAIGCGFVKTFGQFQVARFFLGIAESGVFPATTVLLANWFPRSERARANGYWNLCQPIAIVASAPLTAVLLGHVGWQRTLMLEGALPFIWLPIWWFCIRDHPSEAKWISTEEREFLEQTLEGETVSLQPPKGISLLSRVASPALLVMIVIYFLHNCAAYGCMTFLTSGLGGKGFSTAQYGILFAIPYAVTAVIMILNSWHSDKTHERRWHVAGIYAFSGTALILSVLLRKHFWVSYGLICLAIPGPFAAMAPFWAIPSETLPRASLGLVVGLVNAFGNLGGYAGPKIAGWLIKLYGTTAVSFTILGIGMLIAAAFALLLPKAAKIQELSTSPSLAEQSAAQP
jgi:MFS family permease